MTNIENKNVESANDIKSKIDSLKIQIERGIKEAKSKGHVDIVSNLELLKNELEKTNLNNNKPNEIEKYLERIGKELERLKIEEIQRQRKQTQTMLAGLQTQVKSTAPTTEEYTLMAENGRQKANANVQNLIAEAGENGGILGKIISFLS